MNMNMKTGLILITLGGPRSLEEVPDFIRRFTGRELPASSMQAVIERYRLIGGSSPLTRITGEQAEKLQALLGDDYLCRPAFRHVRPFIEDVLLDLAKAGVARTLCLILSPFYGSVTTGDYLEQIKAASEKISPPLPVNCIHSWYREPLFIESWVEKIRAESFDARAFYLFSAHSLPMKYAEEPYREQIELTVREVAGRAGVENFSLGWQSIPDKARDPWLTPTVEEKIDEIAAAGFKSLVQAPLGFTADHIETLYDIDIVHRRYAESKGLSFLRLSSLNSGETFMKALQRIVSSHTWDKG